MTRTALTTAVAGLVLLCTGAARGEGIQALVGNEGRVQLSRGKEEIAEFRAGLFDREWNVADATADRHKSDSAGKRPLRIAVPGGGEVHGVAVGTESRRRSRARHGGARWVGPQPGPPRPRSGALPGRG